MLRRALPRVSNVQYEAHHDVLTRSNSSTALESTLSDERAISCDDADDDDDDAASDNELPNE